MIICHCTGATDSDLRLAAQRGARSCADIARASGVGGDCGGCAAMVDLVLANHRCAPRAHERAGALRPTTPYAASA